MFGDACYAPCQSSPGPEFGSVGFGVRTDVASASGSLCRLVFRVQDLVAGKGVVARSDGEWSGGSRRLRVQSGAIFHGNVI